MYKVYKVVCGMMMLIARAISNILINYKSHSKKDPLRRTERLMGYYPIVKGPDALLEWMRSEEVTSETTVTDKTYKNTTIYNFWKLF